MQEYRILGPLEVRAGGETIHLGGTRQRSVLALLLLRANEVVSSDRLIDELWGATPPDDAATALHAHISRLRKALPDGGAVLATSAPGYVLRVAPGELDRERFDALAAAGRAALANGDAERAAHDLRAALELWRGRPLADLEHEPFAGEAVVHLEEAWLDALGARIEADLTLGRHQELVPELRALVRAHPLRESLVAQLMVALYRSGRQADALEVYTETRQRLDAELGLEPGPALQRLQQQILVQDPVLEGESRRPHPRSLPTPRRRLLAFTALVGAAAVAAIVTAGVLASRAGPPAPRAEGGLLLEVDARTGEFAKRTPVGRTPSAVAVGGGGVWLLDADTRTISRFDREDGTVSTFATGATPTDVAFGSDSLWVGNGRRTQAQFVGPVTTSVLRIDATSRSERADVVLPRRGGAVSNQLDNRLAATDGALWVAAPDSSLVRIDARSSAITAVERPFPVQAVAAGPAGVWILGVDNEVARVDERTGRVVGRTRIPATSVGSIAVGADAAWVTSPYDGAVWRIDAGPKLGLGSVDVGGGVGDVAVDGASVWVANPLAGTLTLIDAERVAVERSVEVGGIPRSLTGSEGSVFVAVSNVETPPAEPAVEGIEPLPASSCELPVYGGEGRPDVLVVSDLALQGGARVLTTQMAQAMLFTLRQRGFRAGPHRVAYQSCDDSVAATGLSDEAKCASNARAYAANEDVVGVMGPFNSSCAFAIVPVLNRAPGGGLALVGPTTSHVGLTRTGPGLPEGELARLYPTGARTFVRVYPGDDVQMAGLALATQKLGAVRVALLDDGEPGFGAALGGSFERAAKRVGLEVVLHESWDPQAASYAGLARAVQRLQPDAVVLSGLLDANGAQVVRVLRAALGRDVPLLANDGFTPIGLLLEQAGDAARGMIVSLNGTTIEGLGPAGKRFVRAFAATQPGAEIQPSTVYAAQAAEVLLDAIARSDGSRASVLHEVFATRLEDSLLGDVSFDENGDVSQTPVTILRVDRPAGATVVMGTDGASVIGAEQPTSALVR